MINALRYDRWERILEEYRAPTKVKLAALWASTMFCYIYCDYFGLYIAGTVNQMNRGVLGPLGPATPTILIAVSVMMAVPSLMVALSLLLPASVCKWANVVLGVSYTGIEGLTMAGSPAFYIVLGLIEMILTLAIAVIAIRWPRAPSS